MSLMLVHKDEIEGLGVVYLTCRQNDCGWVRVHLCDAGGEPHYRGCVIEVKQGSDGKVYSRRVPNVSKYLPVRLDSNGRIAEVD